MFLCFRFLLPLCLLQVFSALEIRPINPAAVDAIAVIVPVVDRPSRNFEEQVELINARETLNHLLDFKPTADEYKQLQQLYPFVKAPDNKETSLDRLRAKLPPKANHVSFEGAKPGETLTLRNDDERNNNVAKARPNVRRKQKQDNRNTDKSDEGEISTEVTGIKQKQAKSNSENSIEVDQIQEQSSSIDKSRESNEVSSQSRIDVDETSSQSRVEVDEKNSQSPVEVDETSSQSRIDKEKPDTQRRTQPKAQAQHSRVILAPADFSTNNLIHSRMQIADSGVGGVPLQSDVLLPYSNDNSPLGLLNQFRLDQLLETKFARLNQLAKNREIIATDTAGTSYFVENPNGKTSSFFSGNMLAYSRLINMMFPDQ